MADDTLTILRPVPRRPAGLGLTVTSPTPPDNSPNTPTPNPPFVKPQWLDPGFSSSAAADTSLSRPQSFTSLTSPTLVGIYSPAVSSSRDQSDVDRVFQDRDGDESTPWGTGSQTPVRRPGLDDATFELMRDRSHQTRRRSSHAHGVTSGAQAAGPSSVVATIASLTLRAGLLFGLGIGYGMLVTRFGRQDSFAGLEDLGTASGRRAFVKPIADDLLQGDFDWKASACWGIAGVVLGALLPWFDRVWEESFGFINDDMDEAVVLLPEDGSISDTGPGTDWALVMRAIGAFVGIVFAIRKLAWTSTTQISVTLALANPLLWWLIDRSQPGFVLSTAVGLTGSALMLGVSPDMLPALPALSPMNGSAGPPPDIDAMVLYGLASRHTVESGVWAVSALFCSCVCFGNIGRRLAWGQSAVGRGRWGGVR